MKLNSEVGLIELPSYDWSNGFMVRMFKIQQLNYWIRAHTSISDLLTGQYHFDVE